MNIKSSIKSIKSVDYQDNYSVSLRNEYLQPESELTGKVPTWIRLQYKIHPVDISIGDSQKTYPLTATQLN
jgi:hypothetical protein